jgi:hypothetical protein
VSNPPQVRSLTSERNVGVFHTSKDVKLPLPPSFTFTSLTVIRYIISSRSFPSSFPFPSFLFFLRNMSARICTYVTMYINSWKYPRLGSSNSFPIAVKLFLLPGISFDCSWTCPQCLNANCSALSNDQILYLFQLPGFAKPMRIMMDANRRLTQRRIREFDHVG